MIVNLACPKCGKQATEYQENKWSCLYCGNKFVYAPVQPSHTFVQSNIHIQGQATFELDTKNAKSSIPKMVKMIDHDPDHFGKSIAKNTLRFVEVNRRLSSHKLNKQVAQISSVLMGSFTVLVALATVMALISGDPDSNGAVVGLMCVLLTLSLVLAFFNYRNKILQDNLVIQNLQQTITLLGQQNLMDTKVGDVIICPHCEAALDYVPLNSPPPIEGLKHCIKCGRQFFTSGLTSYPVLFKK